jgi:DNA replication protein DnaC
MRNTTSASLRDLCLSHFQILRIRSRPTISTPCSNRLQIEELATGDFIRRQSNLIFVGQSGVGKNHLIQAICMRARLPCTL